MTQLTRAVAPDNPSNAATHGVGDHNRFARAARWLNLAIIVAFFAHALYVAGAASLTIDEGLHLTSGYTIWRTGDYRLIEEHPPLVKLWIALPLLALPDLTDPTTLPPWQEADQLTTESLPLLQMTQQLLYPRLPFDAWLMPSRVMAALLGVLLLATISRWARDVGGPLGALLAVGLASLDPNLVAHSALATTDVGATTLIILALRQSTRFLRSPTRRSAISSGLLLGLALAAKSTGLLLGPALGLAGVIRLATLPRDQRRQLLWATTLLLLTCGLAFWATYGFQIGQVPGIAVPLPAAAHAIPVLRLREHSAGGHQAFLMGEHGNHGWPAYFPIAFLIKTPIPALMAMGAGLALLSIRRITSRRTSQQDGAMGASAGLFVVVYATASLVSPLNIGYRHLLPVLPLGYVASAALGSIVTRSRGRRPGRRAVLCACTVLCLVAQSVAVLRQSPHLLAHFNSLVSGSQQGWRYLADSNTDWGQAFKALAAYQETEQIDRVRLAAFVFYDPGVYGVRYDPLPPLFGDTPAIFPSRFAPEPADYAISATSLDGIPTADPEMYDWFRWREPDARVADALHIYRVTKDEIRTAWVGQCDQPVVPLSETSLATGFGSPPERAFTFDCTRVWLIPQEGPGAYVIHGSLLEDTRQARLHLAPPEVRDAFAARQLDATRIIYRQRADRTEPTFAIFRSDALPQAEEPASYRIGPAAAPPPATSATPAEATGIPVEATGTPVDGPLAFIGARVATEGTVLEAETWWEVTGSTPRPFSVMGHLLSPDGEALDVDDGLGLAPGDLRAGDRLIVRHTLRAPQGTSTGWLRTGAYWLDTLERWRITGQEDADAFFVEVDLD